MRRACRGARVLTEAQAAPEKVSKRVHRGPEFRVTRTDRHCECRVWLDSTQLCFHSANLKSLFPSQLNQDLKGRCLSSKQAAVKSSGERFPGGRAGSGSSDGRWRAGPGKWSSARPRPLRAQFQAQDSQGGPVVKELSGPASGCLEAG